MAHSSIVGLFTQDGSNEWTVDQIIDCYLLFGRPVIGSPWKHPAAPWYGDKAHYWGPENNGVIQQFNYGQLGECGILMKSSIGKAFLLKQGFYTYYINNNGPYAFGWPLSQEYSSGGYIWQNFENGKLRYKYGEAVAWVPK